VTGLRAYGITEQVPSGDALGAHLEMLGVRGYTVLPSDLCDATVGRLGEALERVYRQQAEESGGAAALRDLGEEGIVRAPLAYDPLFVALAAHPAVTALAAAALGNYVVLNQQNGVINPARREFGQAAWHRDLPYQHFVMSRPLALAALFCIDPFTIENGATLVIPGSHRSEAFPSHAAIETLATPVAAASGSFIVFDAMLYHRAGDNRSTAPRRGVNHVFGRAFLRQQIDLPVLLQGRYAQDPALARLFGYHDRASPSVVQWRRDRAAKLAAAGRP
jgi:hypothetical protein